MSESLENRLWQPEPRSLKITFEHEGAERELTFTWDDTFIKFYRTGDEQYDEMLKQFDHVLHEIPKEKNDGQEEDFIATFDFLGKQNVDYLLSSGFRVLRQPTPEDDVVEYFTEQAVNSIPDTLDPDFGVEAA